jgi:glycosyltransferase involved in cell wall biosynthesis
MTSRLADISVIIPTKDCRELLANSIPLWKELIGVVKEIVVVDSHSVDGTLETLKQELGDGARFISHPPGLYQSWNAGIRELRGEYTYISTVGDVITPAGLTTLLEAGHHLGADVVFSPPRIVDQSANVLKPKWPVHRLVRHFKSGGAHLLNRKQMVAANIAFFPGTLIGSSASNLYRTEFLQSRPFPTVFGSEGDSAWAIKNGLSAKWAIVPTETADFVKHARPNEPGRRKTNRFKMLKLHEQTLAEYVMGSSDFSEMGSVQEHLDLCIEKQRLRRIVKLAKNGEYSLINRLRLFSIKQRLGRLKGLVGDSGVDLIKTYFT